MSNVSTELTIVEQITQLPTPEGLFGENIKAELVKTVRMLRDVPSIDTEADKELLEIAVSKAQKATKYASEKRLSVTRVFDVIKDLYIKSEREFLGDLATELSAALSRIKVFNNQQHQLKQAAIAKIEAEKAAELARKRVPDSIAKVETAKQELIAEVQQTHVVAGTREVWKADVVDATLVPRKYLIVDEKALAADVKAGVRSIAGVKIYSELQRTGRLGA